jgi:hypothetical protein
MRTKNIVIVGPSGAGKTFLVHNQLMPLFRKKHVRFRILDVFLILKKRFGRDTKESSRNLYGPIYRFTDKMHRAAYREVLKKAEKRFNGVSIYEFSTSRSSKEKRTQLIKTLASQIPPLLLVYVHAPFSVRKENNTKRRSHFIEGLEGLFPDEHVYIRNLAKSLNVTFIFINNPQKRRSLTKQLNIITS